MDIITDPKAMQRHAGQVRDSGRIIGLVPTMGYLHEGHLSLIRRARELSGCVVVSIFVNPTQFGPGEDLASYPRDFANDCAISERAGVDVIFSPRETDLYPEGYQTFIQLDKLPLHLCGRSRPVHFRGVATVVAKLFNIVKPHLAVFGRKDYQQLMVIRRMVRDLDFDIRILGEPTVRESDGLAMSSRNAYLAPDQRESALSLHGSLEAARRMIQGGETSAARLIAAAVQRITAHPQASVDYIAVADPETLEDVEAVSGPVLMALAVKIGKTRLIDNMVLEP